MAWVPIHQSSIPYSFTPLGDPEIGSSVMTDSQIDYEGNGADLDTSEWELSFTGGTPQRVRITVSNYLTEGATGSLYFRSGFVSDSGVVVNNEAPPYPATLFPSNDGVTSFLPNPVEIEDPGAWVIYEPTLITGDGAVADLFCSFFIEVWDEGPTPPTAGYKFSNPSLAYEMERGWSFDGMYIPHFIELNWLFNDDPFTNYNMNKIRIHGLTKGNIKLQVQLTGMQGEPATDYIVDYMEPQYIDLPFTPIHVTDTFKSTTNYVDYSSRGIAIQMKFEGRNTDMNKPEPAHVIQVLALQNSPTGNGKTIN